MKPSRLQNALKSLGRAPKCIKSLRPDPKIHEILENVGSGLPKIAKCYENPKNVNSFVTKSWNFDHWDGRKWKFTNFHSKINDSHWFPIEKHRKSTISIENQRFSTGNQRFPLNSYRKPWKTQIFLGKSLIPIDFQ